MEYGEATLESSTPDSPAIMAVHPSGSSYRQWSGLIEHIPEGYCSGLYGINLFGYGRSEAWRQEIRKKTSDDLVKLIEKATEHVDAERRWHLIGHSMGGGAVMAAAASGETFVQKLESVAVFEPNLFNLLLVGNSQEKSVYNDALAFFKAMLDAAETKNWDEWGRLFYKFWFVGNWESLPDEVRNTLVRTTLPHTIYEIQSIKSAIDKGPGEAERMIKNLADLKCRKNMVISQDTGEGSTGCVLALGNLLAREAGFEVIKAPTGGHMGPLTHKQQVLPLLL